MQKKSASVGRMANPRRSAVVLGVVGTRFVFRRIRHAQLFERALGQGRGVFGLAAHETAVFADPELVNAQRGQGAAERRVMRQQKDVLAADGAAAVDGRQAGPRATLAGGGRE